MKQLSLVDLILLYNLYICTLYCTIARNWFGILTLENFIFEFKMILFEFFNYDLEGSNQRGLYAVRQGLLPIKVVFSSSLVSSF